LSGSQDPGLRCPRPAGDELALDLTEASIYDFDPADGSFDMITILRRTDGRTS
jgi:hypothetical protein